MIIAHLDPVDYVEVPKDELDRMIRNAKRYGWAATGNKVVARTWAALEAWVEWQARGLDASTVLVCVNCLPKK